MQSYLIFIWIYAAMIATGFWESYVEGNKPWDKGKLGWKIKRGKYVLLTAYHFWLFYVTFPILLSIPFLFVGFSWELFGIILSAYISGLILEDFFWFIANPKYGLKKWNSKDVYWYPWIKIGKFEIPLSYVLAIMLSIIVWFFLWR